MAKTGLLISRLSFLFILSTAFAAPLFARNHTIVRGGKSRYVILVSPKADQVQHFAADELRKYIAAMTGAELAIVTESPGSRFISIGDTKPGHAVGVPGRYAGDDTYRISTSGAGIFLKGASSRGTLYAVYDLLERLGCWWFTPSTPAIKAHSEYIPHTGALVLKTTQITERPLMKYRKQEADLGTRSHSAENWPGIIDWIAKQRGNTLAIGLKAFEEHRELLVTEATRRGITLQVGQHDTMKQFLSPEQYFDRHPDWFGMIEGKRVLKKGSKAVVFETSNEAALKTFEENLISYLRSRPEIEIFQLWPPDAAFWSESPESLAIGSPAERMALFVQHVTKAVRRAGLKTRISFLAYSFYTEPPSNMNFAPDTVLEFCPINQDYSKRLSDARAGANAAYYDQLKRWTRTFPGEVSHYSYYAKYSWRSLPVVLPNQIAKEIQDWHNAGEVGASIYTEPGHWLALEVNQLAFMRASWDADFNAERWYDRYLHARFGRAAGAMHRYFEHATTVSLHALISQSASKDIQGYRTDLDQARSAMAEAAKSADTAGAKWLIDRLKWQADYLQTAFDLRAAELAGDDQRATEFRKVVQALVSRHKNDGTVLERGYGYKAASEID